MTTTTLTKSPTTLIASGTTNAAGAATRGATDMRTASGGMLTIKIQNSGALGAQAVASVLIAHDSGATPATGAAGAVWKTVYSVGNGVASGSVGEWVYNVPPGVMHIAVEVTGNTTNSVTCEAFVSKINAAESV